jgi:hypothetical protein
MNPSKFSKICINSPDNVYPILEGNVYQKTQAITKSDLEEGQKIELYFRNLVDKSCQSCLMSQQVCGTTCPYFKKEAYPVKKSNPLIKDDATKYLCSNFRNFISYAEITYSKRIESFDIILANECLLNEYSKVEGFHSANEYIDYYSKWFGKSFLFTPLNVFRWELIKAR